MIYQWIIYKALWSYKIIALIGSTKNNNHNDASDDNYSNNENDNNGDNINNINNDINNNKYINKQNK